jgi:hypothetical protein
MILGRYFSAYALVRGLSALLTIGVYAAEDSFMKLPIHWMWWPAIGGLAVGLGGVIFPQALGVGYDTIQSLLQGDVARGVIAGVLLVKSAIWVISLGSGASGGVLAPLLMMGAALGGVEAMFLPNEGAGFWPLVSMGAILGGTMRAPFTAILFALELTHDVNALLPLLVAAMLAHGTTVLLLKRSILTEKVARRGFHLSREYSTDPLEVLLVREAMRTALVALPAEATMEDLRHILLRTPARRGQHLYPVGLGRRGGSRHAALCREAGFPGSVFGASRSCSQGARGGRAPAAAGWNHRGAFVHHRASPPGILSGTPCSARGNGVGGGPRVFAAGQQPGTGRATRDRTRAGFPQSLPLANGRVLKLEGRRAIIPDPKALEAELDPAE